MCYDRRERTCHWQPNSKYQSDKDFYESSCARGRAASLAIRNIRSLRGQLISSSRLDGVAGKKFYRHELEEKRARRVDEKTGRERKTEGEGEKKR